MPTEKNHDASPIFLTILLILAIATPAHACRFTKPLSDEQIGQADLIFIGRAIAYQSGEPATITFKVEKVIRGQSITDTIEVYWQNGNFGEPDSLSEFQNYYGTRNHVGIILPQTYNSRRKCEEKPAVTGLGQPTTVTWCSIGNLPLPFYPADDFKFYDKPWVITEPCSETFIAPAEL